MTQALVWATVFFLFVWENWEPQLIGHKIKWAKDASDLKFRIFLKP